MRCLCRHCRLYRPDYHPRRVETLDVGKAWENVEMSHEISQHAASHFETGSPILCACSALYVSSRIA